MNNSKNDLSNAIYGVESYQDHNFSISVTQSPGYLCHIQAKAVFQLPPDILFRQIITHPHNDQIFRHMDRRTHRTVLDSSGDTKQVLDVGHEGSWKFLFYRGKLTTNLIVEQDFQMNEMKFSLKSGSKGVMRKFVGKWLVAPHPDDINSSITYLDQDLALGIYIPSLFDNLLKKISCNQIKKIMEDVEAEVERVKSGCPTLPPWDTVQNVEFSTPDCLAAMREQL